MNKLLSIIFLASITSAASLISMDLPTHRAKIAFRTLQKAPITLQDGRVAIRSDNQRRIEIWDVDILGRTGQLTCTLQDDAIYNDEIYITSFIELNNGKIAAVCENELFIDSYNIRIWDIASGKLEKTLFNNPGTHFITDLKDGRIAAICASHTIKTWNLASKNVEIIEADHDIMSEIYKLMDKETFLGSLDTNIWDMYLISLFNLNGW